MGIIPEGDREIQIRGAIAGEKLRFRITKLRSKKCTGETLEILERAAAETASDCPHFPGCGGCLYRTLPYESQLELKANQIHALLKPVVIESNPSDPYEGILRSPRETAYRNKMEFTFGDEEKNGPMTLGMHRTGSFYDIVNTSACRIVDADILAVRMLVLSFAIESGLPHFHRVNHEGYFRHLLVRKAAATGEILVDLVTTSQARPDLEPLVRSLLDLPLEGKIAGILHTINDGVADTIHNDRTDILWGKDSFSEKLLSLTFKISPFSFFQTNSKGAEVLYSRVRDYIGETKDKVIFDLYSGTGTIAQILSPVAKHVTGVEIMPEAVEAAKENARLNGLGNCDFICGDVLKAVDELSEKPDLIVLDPPREGIHPKALPKIIGFGVSRMVYISCKATSLKRDLEVLQKAGYRVEKYCAADLFPATGHVETVVLMSRVKE